MLGHDLSVLNDDPLSQRASENPSSPSAAYMRQWIWSALIQTMACRIFGGRQLSEPVLGYCQFRNKLQWNFNQNTKLFIYEYASENIVCEEAAIFVQGGWVN